jgi:imidazolonepropionase-like amidohydrolase
MLDVRSGNTIESAVILIDGERITAAGSKLAIPAGAQVIDLGDKTVLPGLIDMHTHLTGDPQDAGYAVVAKSVPRMTMTAPRMPA